MASGWRLAPDWVAWVAQDASGDWWGYEVEPLLEAVDRDQPGNVQKGGGVHGAVLNDEYSAPLLQHK